ncbi:hypothetical protein M378DRAFT_11825, partial [Amanita muscaria Koide BX008]
MARTKAMVKKAQPGPDKTVADSGTVHDTVEANDSRPLNHAQKAAKTRKRNQVAQMVAEATAKTPGPRLAKTVALKNAIWMEAQQPARKRAAPPGSPQKAVRTKKSKVANRRIQVPRLQLQARAHCPPTVNPDSDDEDSRDVGSLIPAGVKSCIPPSDEAVQRQRGKGKQKASVEDPFIDVVPLESYARQGKNSEKAVTNEYSDDGYHPDKEDAEEEDFEDEDEAYEGEDQDDDDEGDDDDEDDDEDVESDGSILNKKPKAA